MRAALNVLHPEVQRGLGGGRQRVGAGRSSAERQAQPLERVGRGGAADVHIRSLIGDERPVGKNNGGKKDHSWFT